MFTSAGRMYMFSLPVAAILRAPAHSLISIVSELPNEGKSLPFRIRSSRGIALGRRVFGAGR